MGGAGRGGAGRGLAVYMQDGRFTYDYNMLLTENYSVTTDAIPGGRHQIVIDTPIARPGAAAEVVITVDGEAAARTNVDRTVPTAFTATETFDVGRDLGSPVSTAYAERRPFAFDGKIASTRVETMNGTISDRPAAN